MHLKFVNRWAVSCLLRVSSVGPCAGGGALRDPPQAALHPPPSRKQTDCGSTGCRESHFHLYLESSVNTVVRSGPVCQIYLHLNGGLTFTFQTEAVKSVPTQLCLTALWQGHHQAAALSCPQRTLNCVCVCVCVCVHARTQSCLTLCDPMDYSPPGSSVHGIFQARIMEWVAIFYFRGSSQLRIETMSPVSPALAGEFFTNCAT